MNHKIISFFIVTSLSLTACETLPTKQTTGAVLGGVAGGVLGSQVGKGKGRDVAMVVGTILGAALGSTVGASMDQTDAWQMQSALENKPTGQTVAWTNPDSQNQYQMTPTRTYDTNTGPCREYRTVAVIEGQREEIYGTACRQPDGSWKSKD